MCSVIFAARGHLRSAPVGLSGSCGQQCPPPPASPHPWCIRHPAYLILSFRLAFLLRHWSPTDKALCSALLMNRPSNESTSGTRCGVNPCVRQTEPARPLRSKSHGQHRHRAVLRVPGTQVWPPAAPSGDARPWVGLVHAARGQHT